MSQVILTGVSEHEIPGITVIHFTVIDDGTPPISRPWVDLVSVPEGSDLQTLISGKVSEYLAEIARQEAIWTAASGMFEFPTIDDGTEQRFIAKEDYIKPLSYSWDTLRTKRNTLLAESDWTQLSDSPLTTEQKSSFATYRQDLRDITDDYSSPVDVIWPTKPD